MRDTTQKASAAPVNCAKLITQMLLGLHTIFRASQAAQSDAEKSRRGICTPVCPVDLIPLKSRQVLLQILYVLD